MCTQRIITDLQKTKWWVPMLLVTSLPLINSYYKSNDSFRLPSSIQPLQYNLTIEPDLSNISQATFSGSVTIKLYVIAEADNITIHARNLTIDADSIKVSRINGSSMDIHSTSTDDIRNFYVIKLDEKLAKDEIYRVHIGNFSGNLKFDNVGFYLAKYRDNSDDERFLALTDFQPIGARKAFPCFDEPALKATFLVSIVRPKEFITASNEELMNTVYLGNGRYKDVYKETPVMSTYIVAFSVSQYEATIRNALFRIFAKPGLIREGKVNFVLSIANDYLNALEDFTGINYNLSKLDIFAVPPAYFEPGGMENWGLITVSENNLICTNTSTTLEIRMCSILACHEIAHQWFGNLVTPSWWNYLWLSEGFSTYMEYYITSLINPSWRMMDQFVIFLHQPLLKLDMKSTQYLNYNLHNAGELPASYTSYVKGAVTVRMLEHILTHDIFKAGLRTYLEKFKFSSATPTDLYNAFKSDLLANLTVGKIMTTWDSQSGYPLVNVLRNYHNGSITLSQEPFGNFSTEHKWIIPINYACDLNNGSFSRTTPDLWLTEASVTIDKFPVQNWLIVNKQQTGYYRVNYDVENWKRLIEFLKSERFGDVHVLNRAQLIDDAFELANMNYVSYEIPLNLSLYLWRESEYVPITSFFNNVEKIKLYLASVGNDRIFQHYVGKLLQGAHNHLGFEEKVTDSHLDKMNRINVMTWSCDLGKFGCLNYTLTKLRSSAKIANNLQVPILCGAMQHGTVDDWNLLYQKYESTSDTSEKTRIFSSLGCTGSDVLLNQFLGILLNSTNGVSVGDRKAALSRMVQMGNTKVKVIFAYFVKHVLESSEMYQNIRFSDTLCKQITSTEQLNVLNMLKQSFEHSSVLRVCVQHIVKNIAWLNEDKLKIVSNWFEDYQRNYLR